MLDNSIGSNKDSLKSICGDGGAPKLSFRVLSKIGSPRAKLFLKPFKFYSLLILILDFT